MNPKKKIEKIEEEKLMDILSPPKDIETFKITIRFQKHSHAKVDLAFELAKKNPYFLEEGEGDFHRIYVSFYPPDAEALRELFNLVQNRKTTRLYLNNKVVPYIPELWLLLMWFYTIK